MGDKAPGSSTPRTPSPDAPSAARYGPRQSPTQKPQRADRKGRNRADGAPGTTRGTAAMAPSNKKRRRSALSMADRADGGEGLSVACSQSQIGRSSFSLTSRFPLDTLQSRQRVLTLFGVCDPPLVSGMMWSMLGCLGWITWVDGLTFFPHFWQRQPSRLKIDSRVKEEHPAVAMSFCLFSLVRYRVSLWT